jgi:hypothetical protein
MIQTVNSVPEDQISQARPISKFKSWVHNLWVDNCEERLLYCYDDRLTEQEYFRRFKWWLRREYRHKQKIEKERYDRQQRLY